MKCYLFILIVVCPVVMNACSNSDSKKIQKNQTKEEALQTDSQIEMPSKAKEEKVEMSSLSPMEADDVPFQYPCDFEFFDMGIIRVSNSRWEEIQCEKVGIAEKDHARLCTVNTSTIISLQIQSLLNIERIWSI